MAELGYTWYPQNWRSSDSVFELTLAEKGLYREIIDQAYMEDNNVVYNPSLWARRHGASVSEIRKIVNRLAETKNGSGEPLIRIEGDVISVPSCEKRIKKRLVSQENGKKGGAPAGNLNAKKQPSFISETTQKQPKKQGKEKEKVKEK